MIRVKIIAPSIAVRVGLRSLLSDDPRIQVIAETASPSETGEWEAESDVVVWSPSPPMDQVGGPVDLSQLKLQNMTALLLIHNDPKEIERLSNLSIRARGQLPTEANQTELVAAVEALSEGLAVIYPSWLKLLPTQRTPNHNGESDLIVPLTGREIEILQLLAQGLTNKQIAVKLGISAHTVKFHVSTIFGKLGTTNRTETVKRGLTLGLILV